MQNGKTGNGHKNPHKTGRAQQDMQAGNKAAASKKEETRQAALFAQPRRVPPVFSGM